MGLLLHDSLYEETIVECINPGNCVNYGGRDVIIGHFGDIRFGVHVIIIPVVYCA